MSYTFDKTLDISIEDAIAKTKDALAEAGFGVLTEIDVQSTMKKKLDEQMGGYVILGACHPPSAWRALQAEKKIGTMLPCNVIVREREDGQVEVSAIDPMASMQAVDNETLGAVAKEVRDSLQRVVAAL